MTSRLWLAMLDVIDERYRIADIPFSLLQGLTKTPKHAVATFLQRSSSKA
jgi:DNA polymerase-3 subunit epsilon